MTLPDVNILLYAFRAELPEHPAALNWLEQLLESGEEIILHPLVAAGFLRLATRKLGPIPPAPMDQALRFLNALGGTAGITMLAEAEEHFIVLSRLLANHKVMGDDVVDTWLAAFAITHELTLASRDQDFKKFQPELNWINPI